MHQDSRFGDNRTGVSANPDLAAEMAPYMDASEGLGSVPCLREPLPEVDEDSAALFVDKLGERLAFERSGVRLYDGLIAKLDAHPDLPNGPDRDELERIRNEELEHFHALEESLLEIGADPTTVTPSADAVGVLAEGVGKLVSDPRASLLTALEAILVAELSDNECWETLIELARNAGLEAMAERFEGFAEHEQEHLMLVRMWIATAQGRAAPARH
jgi:rubrerythrin